MVYAYAKNFGVETEQDYPYEADFKTCRFNSSKSVMNDKGGVFLPSGDEERLKEVVAKFGPVAVLISADMSFAWYKGGVFYDD